MSSKHDKPVSSAGEIRLDDATEHLRFVRDG